jgi:hypothetical protein
MKAVVLLSIIIGLLGCGDDPAPVTHTGTGPLVTYERGGGVASQPQKLVIQRDGRARLQVQTAGKDADNRFTLTAADLKALESALHDARGVDLPTPQGGCADCFEYTVQADGVDLHLDSVAYEDAATPTELKSVVAILEKLAGT